MFLTFIIAVVIFFAFRLLGSFLKFAAPFILAICVLAAIKMWLGT